MIGSGLDGAGYANNTPAVGSAQPPLGVKLDQYKARTDLISWDALAHLPTDIGSWDARSATYPLQELNSWYFDGMLAGLGRALAGVLGLLQKQLTGDQPLSSNKTDVSARAPVALLSVGQVLDYGARKYAPRNWESGVKYTQYFAAAQRHLLAHLSGQVLDHETNLPHLAHAACCLMFLMAFQVRGMTQWDDRPASLVDANADAKP